MVCMTLLAFCFRALIAVGYMPDANALKSGRFAITLCSGQAGVPFSFGAPGSGLGAGGAHAGHGPASAQQPNSNLSWPGQAGGDHQALAMAGAQHVAGDASASGSGEGEHQTRGAAQCPFGPGIMQAIVPQAAIPAVVAVSWHVAAAVFGDRLLPAQPGIRGPPLGSRAPPL